MNCPSTAFINLCSC